MADNEALGKNVRETRGERCWTQEQLADAAGISLRTIQRVEACKGASSENILAIAGAFDVPVETLLKNNGGIRVTVPRLNAVERLEHNRKLTAAIVSNDVLLASALIEDGADVNAKGPDSETPLHTAACGMGGIEMARMLIEKGADVNARANDGRTPLHWVAAAWLTDSRMAELLLIEGADVNAKDNQCMTPLDEALTSSPYPESAPSCAELAAFLKSKGGKSGKELK